VGHELILAEDIGVLEVLNIYSFSITKTRYFMAAGAYIHDIIAIDETHYLLATFLGLLKTTKDQQIKHYYPGQTIISLCHITDSIYLVGFLDYQLIVWNEKTN
jgi:hypothetical protein